MNKLLPQLDYLQVVLAISITLLVYALLKAQKNRPSFNLVDMVLGSDGKVSLTKFAQLGSFLVSTWGFIHLVAYDKLTDWYYTAYMLSWTGSQVLTYWISQKSAAPSAKQE